MVRFGPSFPKLLSLFVVAHFAHHLLTAIPMPLLPLIRNEFGLDYTQSGFVISAFSLSYGIGQVPAGWFADRVSHRILITVGVSGLALAGLLVGFSRVYVMLLIFLSLMGVLAGGYHPAAPPIILTLVGPKSRGRVLGLHMVGGSAAYFLGPIIGTAIAALWGWRSSFIGLAIPIIAFGFVLYWILGRQIPKREFGVRKTALGEEKPTDPRRVLHLVVFLVLGIYMGAVFVSVISFIPLYLVDKFGADEETAGALLGLIYSSGLWVGPLAGYLSDRLGRIRMILAICLASGPVIYLLNFVPYGWGMFGLFFLMGMILISRTPVSESYILGQTSARNRSTILGIYYFAAIEGGGRLTPLLGYIIDHLGFLTSFTIAAISLILVTLVCSIWLWRSPDV
jgi:FSR family fosmidomycin resistance protein-like MFS transporter